MSWYFRSLQTKTFETRALAEQWARAIEVEMDRGVFVSRAEAEATTLKELLERYLTEVTPLKKGAEPETNRLRAFMRHTLAQRFVAGIRDVDIARFRDERLQKVTPATVKREKKLACWLLAKRHAIPICYPSCNSPWKLPCAREN